MKAPDPFIGILSLQEQYPDWFFFFVYGLEKILNRASNPSRSAPGTPPTQNAILSFMRREGFEPPKPLGRLVYSQLRLTTPPPTHAGSSITSICSSNQN